MPRKGPTELSVVPTIPRPIPRPQAPKHFTAAERETWDGAIESMRDSWFSSATFPILRAHCRIVAQADALADELRKLDPLSKEARVVARQHAQVLKSMLATATKLRLCPSSNKSTKDGRRQQQYPRPWEPDPA
jgi:hypothetical protein